MKKFSLLTLTILLVSCSNQHQTTQNTDTTKIVSVTPKEKLKTLEEVKMALIDGRNEKADIFLGKPDIKGRVMENNAYYIVYFDRVTSKGQVKNLLLLINGSGGIDKTSPINYIDAINDGQIISGVANGFIWLKIGKNSITSNCGGLTICTGDTDWSNISISNGSNLIHKVTAANSQMIPSNKKDSVELTKYWHLHTRELSKIDGTYSILDNSSDKFTLDGGTTYFDLIGQTFIDIILKKESENKYNLFLWGLHESNSLKDNYFDKYSQIIPVATIIIKDNQLIFHWYGLYNQVTKKRDWTELDEMPSKDYILKKGL